MKNDGMNKTEIATQLGTSPAEIDKYARELGFYPQNGKVYNGQQFDRIKAMFDADPRRLKNKQAKTTKVVKNQYEVTSWFPDPTPKCLTDDYEIEFDD
jgi:hypothetical protein